MAVLTVHTDGGSRGNPGPSAWGYVIAYDERTIEDGGYLGSATNNVAEYAALVHALEVVQDMVDPGDAVRIFSDSKLMVQQVNGVQVCAAEHLVPFCLRAQAWINVLREQGFPVELKHVRRHLNTEADAVVNRVLDKQESIIV